MTTPRSASRRRKTRATTARRGRGSAPGPADALRGLVNDPAVNALDRRIRKIMTAPQRAALQRAIRALDRPFVEEKCRLAIETALEIQRLGTLKRTALLQRNLWSSLDALAMHFDDVGFTGPFCAAAANVLGKLKFTDPAVGDAEYRIVKAVLDGGGARARRGGMDRAKFDMVMKLAERYRAGRHGIGNISRRTFSFASAARSACNRPLGVLSMHFAGAAGVVKVPIAVIMGAANIATLFVGWWPVTVVTIGVLLVIWAAGC